MKIAAKFALIFALLTISTIGIMGYSVYRVSRDLIVRDKTADLVAVNDYMQSALEKWMEESLLKIEAIAYRPFFRDRLDHLAASPDPMDVSAPWIEHRHAIQEAIGSVAEDSAFFELFIAAADTGRVLFSTDPAQEKKQVDHQPFFIRGKLGSFIQNPYYDESLQRTFMTVSTPIKNTKGDLIAVMGGHLNLAGLSDIMEKGRRFGQAHDIYLVDASHRLVTEPRLGSGQVFTKNFLFFKANSISAAGEGIYFYTSYRNKPVIGAHRWIPERELRIVSEIDRGKAFAPLGALQKNIVLISVILALIAAAAGWLAASTISRPLRRLTRETEKIGRGNLDFTLSAEGKHEVAELARAFGRMTRELSETLVSRDALAAEIEDRKKIEAAFRESENRFRRLAENAKDMIYRMSLPDGIYEYVSPAATDVFGYPPEVFYKEPSLVRQRIHPAWIDYFNQQWAHLLSGKMPSSHEYQIIDPEGRVKWINQRNVLVTDEQNRPIAVEGIVTDVTDIKRVTQEEIRLEKLVVLGRLAAGVAHELLNPLMGVLNFTQYCREDTAPGDEKYSILKDIENETKRCIGIVQNLLAVSRLENSLFGEAGDFSSEEILERVVRLMEYRTSKENVAVSVAVEEPIPKIRMSPDAYQQLCLNLFTNAVDAVEAVENKRVSLRLQKNRNTVALMVSDTGCGISEEIQKKMFDPFYTTKEPGKGTGLGLATCWKIVQQYGGTIQCQSVVDSGTTMIVNLPIFFKEKEDGFRDGKEMKNAE